MSPQRARKEMRGGRTSRSLARLQAAAVHMVMRHHGLVVPSMQNGRSVSTRSRREKKEISRRQPPHNKVVEVTLAVADVEVEVEVEAKAEARVREEMTHAVPVDSWDTGRMIRHAHSSKPL